MEPNQWPFYAACTPIDQKQMNNAHPFSSSPTTTINPTNTPYNKMLTVGHLAVPRHHQNDHESIAARWDPEIRKDLNASFKMMGRMIPLQ